MVPKEIRVYVETRWREIGSCSTTTAKAGNFVYIRPDAAEVISDVGRVRYASE